MFENLFAYRMKNISQSETSEKSEIESSHRPRKIYLIKFCSFKRKNINRIRFYSNTDFIFVKFLEILTEVFLLFCNICFGLKIIGEY